MRYPGKVVSFGMCEFKSHPRRFVTFFIWGRTSYFMAKADPVKLTSSILEAVDIASENNKALNPAYSAIPFNKLYLYTVSL